MFPVVLTIIVFGVAVAAIYVVVKRIIKKKREWQYGYHLGEITKGDIPKEVIKHNKKINYAKRNKINSHLKSGKILR